MSRELWEKVTNGIAEKYINEASECFYKHDRPLENNDEEIGEQAIPIEIKPSEKKQSSWKALLAIAGAAAAVALCVIGGQYLLNSTEPIDPITSNIDDTEETSDTADEATETSESTENDHSVPVNDLEQNITLLPPYNDENYVFDTNNIPFAACIGLPEGWSIEGTRILADGEEIAGISYDAYEIYPEAVGQDNYYRAVYNQIMLGSVVNYGIDYTPVKSGAYYSNATSKRAVRDLETGEITYSQAILAYNDNIRSYIVITFNKDIDPQLLSDIACSIELAWDKIGTSKLLASAFAETWARIYDENGMMKPEIHAIEVSVNTSQKLVAVMFPAAGHYGALIYELDGSYLNYLGEIYNTDTLEIYANDGFMLHTISKYTYGAAAGELAEYVDTYYTIANNTLEKTDHARRVEENGIITDIYDNGQSEMSYEEYIAWKIGQTTDYYYIRSAQFPENEDKLVPISENKEVMAEYFLSVLEDGPPNGGTYDEADGIVRGEKDLTTLYTMIAERILKRDFVPEQATIFSVPMNNAQMVGICYERDGIQCCQLYYIRDNEMYFIGELTDLITLEIIGDDLITSYYTSQLEARYITDSYIGFKKFGDIYIGEEYDRAERLLDENGNVTMYFDCEDNAQIKITETAYRDERNRLREAAGDIVNYDIDLSLPYETIPIEKDIAALAKQISLANADDGNLITEEEETTDDENEETSVSEPEQHTDPYLAIAQNYVSDRVNTENFTIHSWKYSPAKEILAISYPQGETTENHIYASCHLYYINNNFAYPLGRFDNITDLIVYDNGLQLTRQYYEATANEELVVDSFIKFTENGGGFNTAPAGITIKTLDENGDIKGCYTTNGVDVHSDFTETDQAYLIAEQARLSSLLGSSRLKISFRNTTQFRYIAALGIDDLAEAIRSASKGTTANDGVIKTGIFDGVKYFINDDLEVSAAIDANENILWCNDDITYLSEAKNLSELTFLDDVSLELPVGINDIPKFYMMPDGIVIGISKHTDLGTWEDWVELQYLFSRDEMYSIRYYFAAEQ